jgi:serine phosphatase RsbU (regulator of sigma subunit)
MRGLFYRKFGLFRADHFLVMVLSLFCFLSTIDGQNRNIDSLRTVLKNENQDTNKVNSLNALTDALWRYGAYDSGLSYSDKALALATRLNFKRGMADACIHYGIICEDKGEPDTALRHLSWSLAINEEQNNKRGIAQSLYEIGIVSEEKGNYSSAIEYYNRALTLYLEIGDKRGIANIYNELGNTYDYEGYSAKALEFFLKALAINEERKSKPGIASDLNNIGASYKKQDNFPKAIEYYTDALEAFRQIGNKHGMATALGNLGTVYHEMHDYPKTLEYHSASLKMFEELGALNGINMSLANLGDVYIELAQKGPGADSNFEKATNYLSRSLAISRKTGDKRMMSYGFSGMGIIYIHVKNYKLAQIYLDSALKNSMAISDREATEDALRDLSALDSATGNFKEAFANYKRFIVYRDSILNEENTKKTVQAEMNYEFDKKQAAEKAVQEKKEAINEQERKKQAIIRNSFIAGFLLMLALAFMIFRGLQQKQKANLIITKQKEEVEKQKAIVDEKNKDITDSIHYASRIQRALITTDEFLNAHLKDYFVLFKPRDIVSGDFYWAHEQSDKGLFHIACCDCTGHGVPGAFMSLLNISMLNQAVIERKNDSPDLVLNKVRANIIKALNPKGLDSESKDGMDCSYCVIDLKTGQARFACANNPVWIVNNGIVTEIAPDKMPVGMQYGSERPFTLHEVALNKGDCIYMFTDGFADQFGGPKGKKFKYKQLQELITDHIKLSMAKQKEGLEKALDEWKADLEQVDDILVIGIRIG